MAVKGDSMFGYVNIYKPELKVKDYIKFKAYYCGLCSVLRERYGPLGQMTLTYDMTFLVILLTSLYESKTVKKQHRCVVHPVKKQEQLVNELTRYAADMNIALTFHHFMDDWQDEKSVPGLAGAKLLKNAYKRINLVYPRQCQVIEECLQRLQNYEKNQNMDIDLVSSCFGELMAELFVYHQDQWEEKLRKIGFFLGKFIYILDAYDDLAEDIKKENYNPLKSIMNQESFDSDCKNILTLMMSACSIEFEKLPCILDVDILRNILYVGVWSKFDLTMEEHRMKEGIKE